MVDIIQSKLTYKLRENYHQGWDYEESKRFSRRNHMLSQPELFPYIPSSEKAHLLYYRLKYTTNPQLKHLFESFLMYAKQLLKWTDEVELQRGLENLVKDPEKVPELKKISEKKRVDFMNIIDQFRNRREQIMATASEIPLEYGETTALEGFSVDIKEDAYTKLTFSDTELEQPPIIKVPEPAKEKKVVPEEEIKVLPKKDLKEYQLPVQKKEERPKDYNWFKELIEKHYPPKPDNLEIIYRILSITISKASDESMQEDIIGLTGFSKLDMLTDLLAHRSEIRDYMKDALKGIKYDKNNPKPDDIMVILQILGIRLGNIQARTSELFGTMQGERTVSTTIYSGEGERIEDKAYLVQKYKAVPKNEHKEIKRVPLSEFPQWAQVYFNSIKPLLGRV